MPVISNPRRLSEPSFILPYKSHLKPLNLSRNSL
ncbi:hypothetical protein VPHK460_0167 [Vibrio phage K460]